MIALAVAYGLGVLSGGALVLRHRQPQPADMGAVTVTPGQRDPRPSGLRLLVTGGRDFTDRIVAEDALDTLRAAFGVAVLIEGGAKGADGLGRDWAVANGVPVESYPADWGRLGRAAGPIRNGQMLRQGRPQLALAMPGGMGTADMVARLKAARVPTIGLRADGTSEVLVPLPAPSGPPGTDEVT